jgi:GR25 family glycosyltransferase involved in LPS biosynthesis
MAYVPPHRRRQQQPTQQLVTRVVQNVDVVDPTTPRQPHCRWRDDDRQDAIQDDENDNIIDDDDDDDVQTLCRAFSMVRVINLLEREDRWEKFMHRLSRVLHRPRRSQHPFLEQVQRLDAINGKQVVDATNLSDADILPSLEWDATVNAQWDHHIQPPMTKRLSPGEVGCAMSHVQLWKMAVETLEKDDDAILILEDDAVFYSPQKQHQQRRGSDGGNHCDKSFDALFAQAWRELPKDWDIWYLGFSDRGERIPVEGANSDDGNSDLEWFRPAYGFHTHAYAITKRGAERLLSRLPVVGPLDVWLADNQWFDLHVYCCVIKNAGWRGTGGYLITQDRRQSMQSNIPMSARKSRGRRNVGGMYSPTVILLQMLGLFLLIIAAAAATSSNSKTTSASQPPHILFILVDDLGWGNVGYHVDPSELRRQQEVQTPVVDQLAKVEGLELNRHYVSRIQSVAK